MKKSNVNKSIKKTILSSVKNLKKNKTSISINNNIEKYIDNISISKKSKVKDKLDDKINSLKRKSVISNNEIDTTTTTKKIKQQDNLTDKVNSLKSKKIRKNTNFKRLIPKVLYKNNEFGLPVAYFSEIPQELELSKEHVGKKVLVAKHGNSVRTKLTGYYPENSKLYPKGGVSIWNETYEQYESYYLNSVILHPDVLKLNIETSIDDFYKEPIKKVVTKKKKPLKSKMIKRKK
jgi:hypothetical protein